MCDLGGGGGAQLAMSTQNNIHIIKDVHQMLYLHCTYVQTWVSGSGERGLLPKS